MIKNKIQEKENKLKTIHDNETYKFMIQDDIDELKIKLFDLMDEK